MSGESGVTVEEGRHGKQTWSNRSDWKRNVFPLPLRLLGGPSLLPCICQNHYNILNAKKGEYFVAYIPGIDKSSYALDKDFLVHFSGELYPFDFMEVFPLFKGMWNPAHKFGLQMYSGAHMELGIRMH